MVAKKYLLSFQIHDDTKYKKVTVTVITKYSKNNTAPHAITVEMRTKQGTGFKAKPSLHFCTRKRFKYCSQRRKTLERPG